MARILMLDTDTSRGSETKAALESFVGSDLELVQAASGEEAVAIAAREPFDLAIAELVLARPGLGGASALRRLAEQSPGCRTLLISDQEGLENLVAGSVDAFCVRQPGRAEAIARRAMELLEASLSTGDTSDSSSSAVAMPIPPPRPPGDYLARKYRLIEVLGRGGMGVVYRAEDTFIQRPVAIKRVELSRSVDPDRLTRRMHREVRIAGRLRHPNIVTVHDAGIEGGQIFLVMELIEGRNLRDELRRRGALPVDEALGIVRRILAALGHAHGEGVVHRDLKPSNVLLGEKGEVKVTDFGVARLLSLASGEEESDSQESPLPGDIAGTVAYMAPEQMTGEAADPRTDLYSLGAVLFEMLHGRSLASVGGPYARAAAYHAGRKPPPLPQLPAARHLERVLERALAVDRGHRFASSGEFAAALDDAERGGWRRFLPWLGRS